MPRFSSLGLAAAKALGVLVLALFLSTCPVAAHDEVTPVESSDAEMNAAMAHARATLPQFINIIQHPRKTVSHIALKVRFQEGKAIEHMWLLHLTFVNHHFHGQLVDEPYYLKKVKYGDWLDIQPSNVSDWNYVENGKLVGGFTEKLLRKRMTPAERQEFDKSLPYKMD